MSALGISFMTSKNNNPLLPTGPAVSTIQTTPLIGGTWYDNTTTTLNINNGCYSISTWPPIGSGGPTWASTVAYPPQTLTLKMRPRSDELALAEKLAGVEDRVLKNVTSSEYKFENNEETLLLELLSDGQSYNSIYRALYDKEFYLVMDEAAGTSSAARVLEVLQVIKLVSSSQAHTGIVGRLSISLKVKSIALEINDNGQKDIIKL